MLRAQGGAHWRVGRSLHTTNQLGGRRRLCTTSTSSRKVDWGLWWGTQQARGACSPGYVHHLRHAAARGPESLLLAGRDAWAGQRGTLPYIPANMFVTCFYAILDPKSGTSELRKRWP